MDLADAQWAVLEPLFRRERSRWARANLGKARVRYCYARRSERLFAWLHNFRRTVIRNELRCFFIGMRVAGGLDAIVGLHASNFFCYLCAGALKELSALVCLEIYLPGGLPLAKKTTRGGSRVP